MPNSDATITRLKLIKRAFRRIGKSFPTATDLSNAVELLNDKIKEIDVEGKWLWATSNTPTQLTLIASIQSYVAGVGVSNIATNILALERVEIVEGASLTPLEIIGKTTSIETNLRIGTGKPVAVYLEKAPNMLNSKMFFYQTPSSALTVQYYYRRRLYDFDLPGDNPDFPQEWNQKLTKILSYELAPEYGIPLQEREVLRQEMESSMNRGMANNTEDGESAPTPTVYF